MTVVDHLMELIRIPSVSAMTNRGVIRYAENALHAATWQSRRYAFIDAAGVEKINLVAAPSGRSLDTIDIDIAFVCHTDTVPYASTWEHATDPRQTSGFIHGCGACDVKGFLACLLSAVQTSDSEQIADARIILTADEEVGCIGAKQLLAQYPLRPAKVVIGEPTSLHAARAGKGYCLAEVTVTGQEAHSAHPAQGASAILAAAHLLVAFERIAETLAQTQNPLFAPGCTTLNVGTIQGGTAKNIVPGTCKFLVEWRPIPGPDHVPNLIREAIRALSSADHRIQYEFNILRQQPGFETASDSGLVRAVEGLTGKPAASIPFGSEASLFAPICDETVVFGPGDMQTAHSNRECVEIVQLHKAVECMQLLLQPT